MAKKPQTVVAEESRDSYPVFNLHDLRHDDEGREVLDPTPLQPPLNYKRQPSLSMQIRQMIYQQKRELEEMEPETFEEADDFDVGDDYDPHSKWENDFEPSVKELKKRMAEHKKKEAAELAEKERAQRAPTSLPPEPKAGTSQVPPEPTPHK